MNDPMEKPSIERVLENLSTLYNGTNPKETEEASKWLMMIQRSVCLISAHRLNCIRNITLYYNGKYILAKWIRTLILPISAWYRLCNSCPCMQLSFRKDIICKCNG